MLDTLKSPCVTWRIVLGSHCAAAECQPNNEARVFNLDEAGLGTPTEGATGGWRVSSLQLPHMFKSGDNLNTDYESPQDYASKADAQHVACREIAAFFLLSGPQNVVLSQTAFKHKCGVDAARKCAEELQACYADYVSQMSLTSDGDPLWPTYKCLQHCNAPRQPQRSPAQTRFIPLGAGETQDCRNLKVIQLIQHYLLESTWHDTRTLPWEVWISLTRLVMPNKLFAFFKEHQYIFQVEIHKFCWERLTERAEPAHGSAFVRMQPLWSWFAKRGSSATSYGGTSCASHDDSLEIEWVEKELEVGEVLCAWWDGRWLQVTYVGQEAMDPLMNWYDVSIIVRWCDKDLIALKRWTWALQDGTT